MNDLMSAFKSETERFRDNMAAVQESIAREGAVGIEELQQGMSKVSGLTIDEATAKKLMELYDSTKDGELQAEEFDIEGLMATLQRVNEGLQKISAGTIELAPVKAPTTPGNAKVRDLLMAS